MERRNDGLAPHHDRMRGNCGRRGFGERRGEEEVNRHEQSQFASAIAEVRNEPNFTEATEKLTAGSQFSSAGKLPIASGEFHEFS
jgi:hypothetical protein